jgi:hypothetical protein
MRMASVSTTRATHAGHIQAVLRSSQVSRTAAVRASAFLKDSKTFSAETEQAASQQLASSHNLRSTSLVAFMMAQPTTCLSALAG